MDSLYNRMTEDSISDLSKAGCRVDLRVVGYGEAARFSITISKGTAKHGGAGMEIVAEGEGDEGAAAIRGAVATAETYLAMVLPRPAPKLPVFVPEAPMGGRTAAEAKHDDELWIEPPHGPSLDTEERRKANLSGAAQDDKRVREMNDANRELAF